MNLRLLLDQFGGSRLFRLIEEGDLKPAIDRTFPLEETPRALQLHEDGLARGKLVIKM